MPSTCIFSSIWYSWLRREALRVREESQVVHPIQPKLKKFNYKNITFKSTLSSELEFLISNLTQFILFFYYFKNNNFKTNTPLVMYTCLEHYDTIHTHQTSSFIYAQQHIRLWLPDPLSLSTVSPSFVFFHILHVIESFTFISSPWYSLEDHNFSCSHKYNGNFLKVPNQKKKTYQRKA